MGGIVKGIGGILGIGDSDAEKSSAAAMQVQKEILSKLEAVGIPSIEAQRIMLEAPELIGELVPELEGMAEQLDPSAFEDISVSPELQSAQIDALNSLQRRVEEGGMTAADEAELNEVFRRSAGDQRSADAAVMQNLAQRGVLGAGQEIAMRRAAGQEARNRAAREAEMKGALAQQQQLAAAEKLGQMALSQRGQEMSEKSQAAQAADIINRMNLEQRAGTKQRDIERMNQAQQYNIGQKQRIADEGTRMRNLQEQANKALIQQDFSNRMQKAGGAAAAQQNIAGSLNQQAQAQAAGQQQMTSGLMSLGGALGGAALSDKNVKRNITDGDEKVEDMLDNLESYDYDYIPELDDGERHTSVMAQDLEKSELGDRLVEESEMGKMVDYEKALPSMLAGQANLNKRMRKLEKLLQSIDEEEL